jgi:hypothetical protein
MSDPNDKPTADPKPYEGPKARRKQAGYKVGKYKSYQKCAQIVEALLRHSLSMRRLSMVTGVNRQSCYPIVRYLRDLGCIKIVGYETGKRRAPAPVYHIDLLGEDAPYPVSINSIKQREARRKEAEANGRSFTPFTAGKRTVLLDGPSRRRAKAVRDPSHDEARLDRDSTADLPESERSELPDADGH